MQLQALKKNHSNHEARFLDSFFFWHIANDILIIQYNRILILGSQSQQNKDDR